MPMNQIHFDPLLAVMRVDCSGSADEREEAFGAMGACTKQVVNLRRTNGLSELG